MDTKEPEFRIHSRTLPDGQLEAPQMRMLWSIARTLVSNAASLGHDVAAFMGFAVSARRLAVSSAGCCLVRVVVLYGKPAQRALRGMTWDPEDELESFVVTVQLERAHAWVGESSAEELRGYDPEISGSPVTQEEPPQPGASACPQIRDPRWLSQPVRCTSRTAQTGTISRDPVAARLGGTCPFLNPPGDVRPRSGMGIPLHGHPRV